jgi:hypothetical protein
MPLLAYGISSAVLHSFFFFGGLSIHLSVAILQVDRLFSYNITWGATAKEVERSNFFIEVSRILKRFWVVFLLCFTALIGMAVLTTDLRPVGWRVPAVGWGVLLPLGIVAACHILFPGRPCSPLLLPSVSALWTDLVLSGLGSNTVLRA